MSIYAVQMADRWRSTYNPLRGLTMQRVVSLLEEGERGAYADLQWVYRMVEKRDATLRGVKRKLSSSLTKLDWDIKVPAYPAETVFKSPEEQAQWRRNGLGYENYVALAGKQKDALRTAYDCIANLKAALEFLAFAEFRGFSHLEIVVNANSIRLEPIPQWHWCRDGLYGVWNFNADATSGRTIGEPVDASRIIVREVDDPVDEIAIIAFVRKSLSQKDWDGFVETYGLPPLFGKMPPNTPDALRDEYQRLIEQVTSDARGVLPAGAEVDTVGDGVRGIQPFESHVRYQDEEIVLAGTSGKLTMLTAATGMNSGVADAQEATFDAIAVAQAHKVSEVMQQQYDSPLLDAQFPGQPHLAYFELAAKEKQDVDSEFDRAVAATQAGYRIPAAELSERTGYNLTDSPVPVAARTGMMLNRAADDTTDEADRITPVPREQAIAALEEAYQSDMSGVLESLQPYLDAVVAARTPDATRAALAQLNTALGKLPKPEAARMGDTLTKLMGQQVLAGAQTAWAHYQQSAPQAAAINNSPRHDNHYNRDSSGRFASGPSANIKAGKAALKMALRRKASVSGAMSRPETGNIDFEWGNTGDKSKDHKGGYGLSHIQAKHGDKALREVPEVIARGTIKDNPRGDGKYEITHKDRVVSLAKRPKGRAAVVTSYTPKP